MEMNNVKNVVLDVGGVLVGFRWDEMLARAGFSKETVAEFADSVFPDPLWEELDLANEPYDHVVQKYVDKYPHLETIIRYFFFHPEEIVAPRTEVWNRLLILHEAGYRLYLLSNYSSVMLQAHLGGASFWPYLSGKVISYEIHSTKPGRRIYEELLSRYDLKAEECLFLDDQKENVEAGEALGIPSVFTETEADVLKVLDRLIVERSIRFDPETKVISLRTGNSSYQMQIGKHNVLLHLYYGAPIGDTEGADREVFLDRGFSPNYFDTGEDRTYSQDTLMKEYSGAGNGDYRVCALDIRHGDGSQILDLRYVSHTITDGKYSLAGMPALFGADEEARTLDILMRDKCTGVEAHLLYSVFPLMNVITRTVRVENNSSTQIVLEKVLSSQLEFADSDMDMFCFYGGHVSERRPERRPLRHGIQSFGSRRGTSSHHYNPFAILARPETTETSGDCYGMSFVYSGNFLCEAEVDQTGQTRILMGIHPDQFAWRLQPGESFEAPETVMAFSDQGLEKLTHIYHDVFRKHLIRSPYVNRPRPVLVNNWEATYFDFDEDKLLSIASAAKEIGLDLFVLDDGWFGQRNSDNKALGDWTVNREKLPDGMRVLAEKIHGMGLKFGLWIEPEMISENSDLYRMHPDWCMAAPGREPVRGRDQLNLDITRKEVREHVMGQIFAVMDDCGVDYIKWDMNRSVANVFSHALPAEQQGEVLHRYVLGLYEMMEALVSRYPDLLFENCSGGGGRFDPGMLYYSPQIWCSDNTDAIDRLLIQYGTSFAYPISTMGAHVSVCPNHQTGRTVPVETRGVVASAGTFGFELDLTRLTAEEKELARRMLQQYHEEEQLVLNGDYYRLCDPQKNNRYVLWEIAAKDKSEAVVNGVMLQYEVNPRSRIVRLRGLDPAAVYLEKNTGKQYTGAYLMNAGLVLPNGSGQNQPLRFHFFRH